MNKRKLLLIGGGGHAKSCIDVIESTDEFTIKGLVQNELSEERLLLGYKILGTDDDLPKLLKEDNLPFIAIGQIKSPDIRIRLFGSLKSLIDQKLPIIKSSTSYCSGHALIGEGSILMHKSFVNAGAYIGANCIINTGSIIEHDVEVLNHCHVSTGARLNGGVKIGEGSFVGSGCVIKEGVTIGPNSIIGAGRVILKDLPANSIITSI
jgi:sugar O-acyltransferase (sialic acid O-acetyltransferase NeuD family)